MRAARCTRSSDDFFFELGFVAGIARLQMNDIARVGVKVQQPLVIDSYARNRATGSFIVIDETSHNTVAAGMIV